MESEEPEAGRAAGGKPPGAFVEDALGPAVGAEGPAGAGPAGAEAAEGNPVWYSTAPSVRRM